MGDVIYISHRGNLFGPKPEYENTSKQIDYCLNVGYDVEIDLWWNGVEFRLGHEFNPSGDVPSNELLLNEHVWCHAKTLYTLQVLLDRGAHCFFHDSDKGVLTSNGYIWTYPGQLLYERSVCVLPERAKISTPLFVHGVCSDYVGYIKQDESFIHF